MSLMNVDEKGNLVDSFSGKEIKDPYGPPKDSKTESKGNQTEDILKMVWFDLIFNGSDFPVPRQKINFP